MFASAPEINIKEIKIIKKDTNEVEFIIKEDDNIDEE